jgi:hypothetical protein
MSIASPFVRGLLVSLASLVCSTAALAVEQRSLFEAAPVEEWKELEVVFPAYPTEADLQPLSFTTTSSARFLIDLKTLSKGTDEVIRYVMVVRTEGGAENVSYEGIRCDTAERRIYALGRQGAWVAPRVSEWTHIIDNTFNRYPAVLAKEYFCPPGSILPTQEQILRALRRGGL